MYNKHSYLHTNSRRHTYIHAHTQVLGTGTFGLVLRAEYRGTYVAVKRALPVRCERKHSYGLIDGTVSPGASSPFGAIMPWVSARKSVSAWVYGYFCVHIKCAIHIRIQIRWHIHIYVHISSKRMHVNHTILV